MTLRTRWIWRRSREGGDLSKEKMKYFEIDVTENVQFALARSTFDASLVAAINAIAVQLPHLRLTTTRTAAMVRHWNGFRWKFVFA